MKKRVSIITADPLNYAQFESKVIEAIIDAYITKNGNEYYLIIDLMKIEKPEFMNIIKNALIIILSLFFLDKPFECGDIITTCKPHEKELLESICILE